MSIHSSNRLNTSNFFHYYALHPLADELLLKDRIKAFIGTICLFECLSKNKLQQWEINSINHPFKKGIEQQQFDKIFPHVLNLKEAKESRIRQNLIPKQIEALWDYFDKNRAFCISPKQVKNLDFFILNRKMLTGHNTPKRTRESLIHGLFGLTGPFAEEARRRFKVLSSEQLKWVISDFNHEQLSAVSERQYKKLDCSYMTREKEILLHSIMNEKLKST